MYLTTPISRFEVSNKAFCVADLKLAFDRYVPGLLYIVSNTVPQYWFVNFDRSTVVPDIDDVGTYWLLLDTMSLKVYPDIQ